MAGMSCLKTIQNIAITQIDTVITFLGTGVKIQTHLHLNILTEHMYPLQSHLR